MDRWSAAGRRTAALLAGAAALSLVAWTLVRGDGEAGAPPGPARHAPTVESAVPVASPSSARAALPNDDPNRSIARIEDALFVKGSLRGTDHPAWGTARGEAVRPNRALRDRFDHYLLAMNEATVAELTALLAAHAERDLGPATAGDIVAVWQRYLQLQQHPFQRAANPGDPASMQAALQEHRQVRQGILGMHWAQAFYGDDEAVLEATLTAAQRGTPTRADPERLLLNPPRGVDAVVLHQQRVAHFGADIALRLQAVDVQDAQWEQRVARSRIDVEALRSDPSRSAPQRDAALASYLQETYPDATERLRASGLLGL